MDCVIPTLFHEKNERCECMSALFCCNTCQDAFCICKITLEKNQLFHFPRPEFTYNNLQKRSCQICTCFVFTFVLSMEMVVGLFSFLNRLSVNCLSSCQT